MKNRVSNIALVGLGFLAGAITLSIYPAMAQNLVAPAAPLAQVTDQPATC
jgi:hypothetical protein